MALAHVFTQVTLFLATCQASPTPAPPPACGQVTCALSINDRIRGVWVDGTSLIDQVVNTESMSAETVQFSGCSSLIAVQGEDNEGGCRHGGFAMHCISTFESSPWHDLVTDVTHWRGSTTGPTGWTNIGFDDTAWVRPSLGQEMYTKLVIGNGATEICMDGAYFFRRVVQATITGSFTFDVGGASLTADQVRSAATSSLASSLNGVQETDITVEVTEPRRLHTSKGEIRRLPGVWHVDYTVTIPSGTTSVDVRADLASTSSDSTDFAQELRSQLVQQGADASTLDSSFSLSGFDVEEATTSAQSPAQQHDASRCSDIDSDCCADGVAEPQTCSGNYHAVPDPTCEHSPYCPHWGSGDTDHSRCYVCVQGQDVSGATSNKALLGLLLAITSPVVAQCL